MHKPLTTHHALKALALILMTVDHVGAYLYPDVLWLRAIGRVTVPVWFFLVGVNPNPHMRAELVRWALLFAVVSPFLGVAVLPFNVLVTILFCQWVLQVVERRQLLQREPVTVLLAAILFFLPCYVLMEYGTTAVLYALMGYALRAQIGGWRLYAITLTALLLFVAAQLVSFDFTPEEMAFVILGTTVTTLGLLRYRYRPLAAPTWLAVLSVFLSRISLRYYVIHRVLLQAVGVSMHVLNPALRWL